MARHLMNVCSIHDLKVPIVPFGAEVFFILYVQKIKVECILPGNLWDTPSRREEVGVVIY